MNALFSFADKIAVAALVFGLSAISARAAEKLNFSDQKGVYRGTWNLVGSDGANGFASSPGQASIQITARSKGKSGAIIVTMGPVSINGVTSLSGLAQFTFSGKVMTIGSAIPGILPGLSSVGTYSAKKRSINGVANLVVQTGGGNPPATIGSTLVMTSRSSKKRQTVKLVYTVNYAQGAGGGTYVYTFEGSKKLRK
jgi:hypothetical protein